MDHRFAGCSREDRAMTNTVTLTLKERPSSAFMRDNPWRKTLLNPLQTASPIALSLDLLHQMRNAAPE